jgi:hypothetical protein
MLSGISLDEAGVVGHFVTRAPARMSEGCVYDCERGQG